MQRRHDHERRSPAHVRHAHAREGRHGAHRHRRRHRRGGPVGWGLRRAGSFLLAAIVLVTLAVGLGHQRLRQGPVSLGPQAAALVASRIEAGAEGLGVHIGDVQFALGAPGRASGLRLIDVTLRGADGEPIAAAPELVVDFRLVDALQGRLEPTALELRGVTLALVLQPDRTVELAGGPAPAVSEAAPEGAGDALAEAGGEGPGVSGFLTLLDQAAGGEGPLRRFASLSARDATVTLLDAATGVSWRLQDAEVVVALEADGEVGRLSGRLANEDSAPETAAGPGADDPVRQVLEDGAAPAPDYPEAGDVPDDSEAGDAPDYPEAGDAPDDSSAADPALAGTAAEAPAPYAILTGRRNREDGMISARLVFRDLPLSDLASAPALGDLAGVESRGSGQVDLTLDGAGAVQTAAGRLTLGPGALGIAGLEAPFDRIDAAIAEAAWERAEGTVDLTRLSLHGPAGALSLSGVAEPWGERREAGALAPTGWRVTLDVDALSASEATGFVAPLSFQRGRIEADVLPAERRLELATLTLESDLGEAGALPLHAQGVATLEEAGPRVAIRYGSDGFDAEALKRAWPRFAAPGAREWVTANVEAARITGMSGAFWMAPGEAPEVTLDFGFADLSGTILEGMPRLIGAAGRGRATLSRFEMAFDAAQTTPPGGGPISLAGSRFIIPDLVEDPQPAAPVIRGEGRLGDLLALIDQPPLRLTRKLDMDLGSMSGRASVEARLSFRLLKDLDVDDVAVEASARIRSLEMTAPGDGPRIVSDDLRLTATPDRFRLWGEANIGGRAAQVSWVERFDSSLPADQRRQVEADVSIGQKDLAQFGLDGALEMPQGRISADVKLTGEAIGDGFVVTANLGPAALRIPEIGWEKAKGEAGTLTVSGRTGDDGAVELRAFELKAPGLAARGSASLGAGGALRRVALERLTLDGVLDAALTLDVDAGGGMRLSATGRRLDIAGLTARRDRMADARATGGAAAPGGEADAGAADDPLAGMADLKGDLAFDVVTLVDGVDLTAATGELSRRRGVTAVTVAGRVNGGAEARLRYREGRRGGITLSLRSDDAGRLLDDLEISDAVQGGSLKVRGRLPPGESTLEGVAELTDLRVAGRKALDGVVSAARRDGVFERKAKEVEGGYHFYRVEAPFRLRGDVVTVTDALATGALLALKVNGDYDLGADRLDLQGVLTPAYAVNGLLNNIPVLGELFGGEGEGIFAMNFTVTGDAADPVIDASPLSFLTPGVLRRLLQPGNEVETGRDRYPDLFQGDR
ncbi:AsmA-like C-terminal region-containing protein [Albimonas sp. CAU 1670]|uniref:AsmA-like C-terminal region-containing protein n=1 Tax=Albimonas sp. CAU 1670 TaxID=3032599 RepID=UPI0023DC164E|nr:AsmA-like C-terminal region-containing protein [Albimonas sp. CAU 1670]MDF2232544.1 AsmA-like C-terminal region-containing protein [Albimonas sp. CAU 1670]